MVARAHPTIVSAACGALATLVLGMLAACSSDLTSVTCTSNADCPSNRCEAGRCIEGAAPDDATDATEDTADVTEDPSTDTADDTSDVVEDAASDDAADALDVTDDAVADAREAGVDVAPDTLADAPDDADAAVSDTSDAAEDVAPDIVADAPDGGDVFAPDASDASDASPGALGAACSSGSTCESGFCGNGHCAPEGFSYIAPGVFTMGSPDGELGRDTDETQHSATLTRAFFLQQTEVTQGQWRTLMGNNPSEFAACGDDCPVDSVNWYEALAYANALSDAEGLARCYTLSGCSNAAGTDLDCSSVSVVAAGGNPLLCEGYRLPTESEWEYAARAGTTTATYRGNLQEPTFCEPQPNLEPIAWYCGNAGSSTHQVATRASNTWDLHDMLGNVWEWCWDWHGPYPATVTDPLGTASGTSRVIRGGGWSNLARGARAAYRNFGTPGYLGNDLGFRVARTL